MTVYTLKLSSTAIKEIVESLDEKTKKWKGEPNDFCYNYTPFSEDVKNYILEQIKK